MRPGHVLLQGCFVDLCSPSIYFHEYLKELLPHRLVEFLRKSKRKLGKSDPEFMSKVQTHIDSLSGQNTPWFTYIHTSNPGHIPPKRDLSTQEMESFRNEFPSKIQTANHQLRKIIQHILARDPKGVIIINADHGAWGLKDYPIVNEDHSEGKPGSLIALDQLGVLLAIRWPEDLPNFIKGIRTNINVFSYLFCQLK